MTVLNDGYWGKLVQLKVLFNRNAASSTGLAVHEGLLISRSVLHIRANWLLSHKGDEKWTCLHRQIDVDYYWIVWGAVYGRQYRIPIHGQCPGYRIDRYEFCCEDNLWDVCWDVDLCRQELSRTSAESRSSVLVMGAWNSRGFTTSWDAATRNETKDVVIIIAQRRLNFAKLLSRELRLPLARVSELTSESLLMEVCRLLLMRGMNWSEISSPLSSMTGRQRRYGRARSKKLSETGQCPFLK